MKFHKVWRYFEKKREGKLFASTWIKPQLLGGVPVVHLLGFLCCLCFILVVCIMLNNVCLSGLLILDSTSVFSNDLLHYVSWNCCCIFIFITTLNNTKSPQMVYIEGVIICHSQWCLNMWVSEWLFLTTALQFSAISWREQVNLKCNDDEVLIVQDQHP